MTDPVEVVVSSSSDLFLILRLDVIKSLSLSLLHFVGDGTSDRERDLTTALLSIS